MADYTYANAVNMALRKCMQESPEALLYGEDIAIPGGVFGVTKNLRKEFGDRVFDTPISESAIIGSAIGASMFGMRPIIEIMWLDFMLVAFDQIVNQAANVRYVSESRLKAPITIRTQAGSSPGACAQHSQNLEAMLAHVPGLIVGMPSTPQDAYDMLIDGFNVDDPTIIIENRTFYHSLKSQLTTESVTPSVGEARVVREGRDATVVAWSGALHRTIAAADALAAEGIELEIIDPRWLRPLDTPAIVKSASRTGSLIVVHDAHTFAGLGAEVVAGTIEGGVRLHRPPLRIGAPDARIPAAPALLQAVIPQEDLIAKKIRKWMETKW